MSHAAAGIADTTTKPMNTVPLQNVLHLYKPPGWTPLETIRAFQQKHPAYAASKLGYAGRLDPMAEGIVLVLVGEENKKRKEYEQLSKEYVFEVLFGISTDSYDVLGLITENAPPPTSDALKKKVPLIRKQFTGTITQPYPPYSSKPVNGKPLYWWARNNRLSDITIPSETRTVSSLSFLKSYLFAAEELHHDMEQRIRAVKGKFRQKEIIDGWNLFFQNNKTHTFPVIRFQTAVSSGTYIRSLVHAIGNYLGIPAMTLSITRTKVGSQEARHAISLDR